MNTVDKVKTLFWIITTVKECGPITLNDLSNKWENNELSKEQPFDRNTFKKYLDNIADIFGIRIYYTHSGYRIDEYLMANAHQYQNLVVSHIQDIEFYTTFRQLGDKLQADDIPGGAQYLGTIGKALSDNLRLRIEYMKFANDISTQLTVEPYCIKSKERRWYMLAKNIKSGNLRTYALDRIQKLEPTTDHFKPDRQVDLKTYYSNCIGVYVDDSKIANIKIRVSDILAKYLRKLPMHASQYEVEPCTFRYHVDITPDLINKILEMGSNATVLEPKELRDKVQEEIQLMLKNYQ